MHITQDEVIGLFEYHDNNLWWREQPGSVDISKPAGSIESKGYRLIGIKGKAYKAHRLIFLMHHGWLPKQIDHIDNNKSNNKLDNLRDATKNQNQHNQGKHKNNKSGYKGVTWHKRDKKWQAQIMINYKQKHLGYFDCPKEAHVAYCHVADKYHGDFANHG
jgi:hypothetical protein